MRTGDVLDRSGTYRTGCPCGARAVIAHGMRAPICPICGRSCNWILVELKENSARAHAHPHTAEARPPDARPQT